MAQSGYTPLSLYYSATAATAPLAANLVAGELALNTNDGKLYYKDSSGVVQTIASKGTGTIGGSTTQVQYNNAGAFAGSANFVWDNTNGRLGIGTSSPSEKLEIAASGTVYGKVRTTSGGAGMIFQRDSSATTQWLVGHGAASANANFEIYTAGSGDFNIQTNGSERMRIVGSSGNVGIGTSSPVNLFHTYQSTANTDVATFQIASASAYVGFNNFRVGTSGAGTFIGGTYTPDGSLVGLNGTNGLIFATNNNTEKMRIDTNGNVGIGTSSPAAVTGFSTGRTVLQIKNTSTDSAQLRVGGGICAMLDYDNSLGNVTLRNTYSAAGALLNIDSGTIVFNSGTSYTERMRIASNGNIAMGTSTTGNGRFTIEGYTTSAGNADLLINRSGTASTGVGNGSCIQLQNTTSSKSFLLQGSDDVLQFLNYGTSWNERMRIDSSGNLLVGVTAPINGSFAFGHFASVNGGKAGISVGQTAGSSASSQILFINSNGTVGSISTSGSLTSYNVSSDRRLKENITPLTTGLQTVLALKPSQYNYISEPSQVIQGFIADELQEIVPHAVNGEKDAVDEEGKPVYQGVDASFLIPFLVSAIQELKAEVDALKAAK